MAERDEIAVHSYQLMLAAMRGRSTCSAAISAEVTACLSGTSDGYTRYSLRVGASRDAATRLFGLELLREFCRDKTGRNADLAEKYYASAATMLPLDTAIRGSTSARHAAVFHEDPVETCWSIRRVHDMAFACINADARSLRADG